jgi:hypothetical protein
MLTSIHTKFILALAMSFAFCNGIDKSGKQFIFQFMSQYKRPITLFEACGASEIYGLELEKAKRYDVTAAVLLLEPSAKIIRKFKIVKPKNVTLMSPSSVVPSMIKNLSRCEQPDVVLLHDVPTAFKKAATDYVTPFLHVGDYLIVDVKAEDVSLFDRYHKDDPLVR